MIFYDNPDCRVKGAPTGVYYLPEEPPVVRKKCPRGGHIIKTLRLPPSGPLNISVNHTSPCYSLVAASNNKLEIYRLC